MIELKWDNGCRPWLAASDDHTRPVLCHVLLDARGFMIATNAHLLAVISADVPPEYDQAAIPAKFFRMNENEFFFDDVCLDGEQIICGEVFARIIRPSETFKFPIWQRFIFREEEADGGFMSVGLSSRYLDLASKILGDSDHLRIVLNTNNKLPQLIVSSEHPQSFVALMPTNEAYKNGLGPDTAWDRFRALCSNGNAA